MKRNILFFVLTFLMLSSFCQQGDSLINVTGRLYMIAGLGGNVSFLVTDEGVLVVDAGTVKKDGEIIANHIKSVTDKPVRYIILTHYHYDHIFGVCGFRDSPVIIGHKNIINNLNNSGQWFLNRHRENLKSRVNDLREKMDSLKMINDQGYKEADEQYKSNLEKLKYAEETFIVYPDITFESEMTIYSGSDTVVLTHPGNTHTDCNILVSFINQNTLSTGDFFFNHSMPYIDFDANCDTENWIKQINKYAGMNYQYIIPGHGKLANSEDLRDQGRYISDLRNEIKSLVDKQKTLEEIQTLVKMTDYSHYEYQRMLPLEIEAIYRELTERKN